jgi:N-acetylneuraminate synthase/sialic acid synthase
MGKMIVAARNLPAGHRITLQDIEYRSPFKGLPPSDTSKVLGKTLKFGLSQFTPLSLEILN